MDGRVPLPTLLSHALVAFTIEFDNEFEHQASHRTTNHGSTTGARHAPWLVSRVMWSNFMRFVPEEGTTIGELKRLLPIPDKSMQNLVARMSQWWSYITVEPKPAGNASRRIPLDALVRPTAGGRRAIEVWQTLDNAIEARWRERFGDGVINSLREALAAIVSKIDVELPHGLPILGYGLYSHLPEGTRPSPGEPVIAKLPLSALLSQALLWFAVEFERESPVSLAISANVLRLLSDEGARASDLQRLASVSKEAIATSLSFLTKRGYAVMKSTTAGSRTRVIALTAKGRVAQGKYRELLWAVEERWRSRFGGNAVSSLRESLERLVYALADEHSLLFQGLEPYPDGWRASFPKLEGLPHYPMVLHRGGFPDGS
jgi:DNA-binding MarR family transcriptional regulator